MTARVPAVRRENLRECVNTGDFVWVVPDDVEGVSRVFDPAIDNQPSAMWFRDTDARLHHIPIAPARNSPGATWSFDGNLDQPTLKPSIRSSTQRDGVMVELWHGFITAGEVVSC